MSLFINVTFLLRNNIFKNCYYLKLKSAYKLFLVLKLFMRGHNNSPEGRVLPLHMAPWVWSLPSHTVHRAQPGVNPEQSWVWPLNKKLELEVQLVSRLLYVEWDLVSYLKIVKHKYKWLPVMMVKVIVNNS